MKLKDFKLILIVCFCSVLQAQHKVSGIVTNADTNTPLEAVQVYDKTSGLLTTTNTDGSYEFVTEKSELVLAFFSYQFKVYEQQLSISGNTTLNVSLQTLGEELSEVEITARKEKVFELSRLKDVEETAIFAGKKTEVVLVEQSMANLATNNARQIYSQVAGLNIFQNDDAGLQLNIGGRGLDPRRTSNFNTRQNGYDISADVLGYPESYYTPPAEILSEIQVVRGAASLQYGTQFGGLVNFKFKEPNPNKPFNFLTRRGPDRNFCIWVNFPHFNAFFGTYRFLI